MPQISTGPIGHEDIVEFVDGSDDFSFEMRVFHETAKGGFHCEHGGTYTDPSTGLPRQFDIRAHRYEQRTPVNQNRRTEVLFLAVECKNLTASNPLVVSRVPRTKSENFIHLAESGGRTESRKLGLQKRTDTPLYEVGKLVGKSTVQVARKRADGELIGDDSQVYNKWAQAIASARDMIAKTTHFPHRVGMDIAISLTLPVLVVPDGRLWTVDYNETGLRIGEPKLTDSCDMFIGKEYEIEDDRNQTIEYIISHLHFCTLTGYKGLLNKVSMNRIFWNDIFSPNKP